MVGCHGQDVFVELGPRSQGVIRRDRFAEEPELGAEYEFTLRGMEEGLWVLELHAEPVLVSWERMEVGELVQARVVRRRPGGYETKVGALHAFLPQSHSGLPRGKSPNLLLGKTLTCEVFEVDRERQRVFVSRRYVVERERRSERDRVVTSLRPGTVLEGRVARLEEYGAFIKLPGGMQGLAHVSDLSHERLAHANEALQLGDTVQVKVLFVRAGGKRIGLGVKQLHADPWREFTRDHEVGEALMGEVQRIAEFGLFVRVASGVEGLLHKSCCGIGDGRRIREEFQPGQELAVRIVDLDPDRQRLSLSLLHVDGSRVDALEVIEPEDRGSMLHSLPEPTAGKTNLGALLRRAMRQDESA
ncbi:MAG: 30S ribosomal protein S1 [Planctomycetes bacterium]|nr:30S ribosomal protein S1 [Planctomycetota bacterium]